MIIKWFLQLLNACYTLNGFSNCACLRIYAYGYLDTIHFVNPFPSVSDVHLSLSSLFYFLFHFSFPFFVCGRQNIAVADLHISLEFLAKIFY